MANTYTQIYIQAVFAVENRQSLISKEMKTELFKYISGTLRKNGHKLLQINGMPDHVHVLFGLNPTVSVSEVVKLIKQSSSFWINNGKMSRRKFSWQKGFGAFSYSKSELESVIRYIINQETHHKKVTFQEEYQSLLKEHEVEFDERYVLKGLID
jgi:REP element-mobilizing transposase RayT